MRILFLHDNFPAQFGFFGQYLSRNGWDVVYGTQRKGVSLDGVKIFNYSAHRDVNKDTHPYARSFEKAVITGQGLARAGNELKARGYAPDIIMAHSGWGPGLYAKDIWPHAKYIPYLEWYYQQAAPDVEFTPLKDRPLDEWLQVKGRNAAIVMDLAQSAAALCPTKFQRDQFPAFFWDKIKVMHDGVDTDYFDPALKKEGTLEGHHFDDSIQFVTYVARGMEPYRGFMEFMRVLEIVMREHSNVRAIIVGEDRVAYGKKLPPGDSYKKRAMNEINLDWKRVHFTGLLNRKSYRQVLFMSDVHVYLTIPFVLSWSLMEAMSAGCAIVASDVEPVREVASQNDRTMSLVQLQNREGVAAAVLELLENPELALQRGSEARKTILSKYSANKVYAAKEKWLRNI